MLVSSFYGLPNKKWEESAGDAFRCGCEYEIENIFNINHAELEAQNIKELEDGSLRNNGREFVSGVCSFEEQLGIFDTIHGNVSYGKEAFSDRTSIHVHVNVRRLSLAQLKQFLLCYALVEPLFFRFVDKSREGSIYCVPLTHTSLPSLYHKATYLILKGWHKYTALNMLPVAGGDGSEALGSVEFRHLQGTNDPLLFRTFLTTVKSIYEHVTKSTPTWKVAQELTDNTTTIKLVEDLVPLFIEGLSTKEVLSLLKNTLLDVKLSELV